MIGLSGADGAVGVSMLVEGGRRGVSLHSRAPAIIGALGGNKGDPGLRGIRRRGSGGVKE